MTRVPVGVRIEQIEILDAIRSVRGGAPRTALVERAVALYVDRVLADPDVGPKVTAALAQKARALGRGPRWGRARWRQRALTTGVSR